MKKDQDTQTLESSTVKVLASLPHDEFEFPQILYKKRSITALFVLFAFLLVCFSVSEGHKAALIICSITIMWCSAACQDDDGLLRRPHPACWRMLKGFAIFYWIGLIFIGLHDRQSARDMLNAVFSQIGKPLPEKNYADDCRLYTPENPESKFYNFMDTFYDAHTFAHLAGWWAKTCIIRDWKLCFFLSVFFEWLEVTFRYHLPNFWECWWDHLFLDMLGCNALGIFLGHYTCKFFEMKQFYFTTPPLIMEQLTPYSWVNYRWEMFSSPKKFLCVMYIIIVVNLIDLANFYLRFILFIPHNHGILGVRVML